MTPEEWLASADVEDISRGKLPPDNGGQKQESDADDQALAAPVIKLSDWARTAERAQLTPAPPVKTRFVLRRFRDIEPDLEPDYPLPRWGSNRPSLFAPFAPV
jgi:hypothetical protein